MDKPLGKKVQQSEIARAVMVGNEIAHSTVKGFSPAELERAGWAIHCPPI